MRLIKLTICFLAFIVVSFCFAKPTMAAVSRTGSIGDYHLNANSGTQGSITCPDDANLVVVTFSGWQGTSDYFTAGAYPKFGAAGSEVPMLLARDDSGNNSLSMSAVFYLRNPSIGGSKNVLWDFAGTATPVEGVHMHVAFYKGVDVSTATSAIRSAGGQQDFDPVNQDYTTGSMSCGAGDLAVANATIYSSGAGSNTVWTNAVEVDDNIYQSEVGSYAEAADLSIGAVTITAKGKTNVDGTGAISGIVIVSLIKNVYYSVGQNTADHSSGGNVSITSGVATFTVPQIADNLGVGDKLIAGGSAYYLASKTDTTHWNVVTKLGAVPSDLGSTTVTSIAHEYASLFDAEAGASDANHISNTSLVAANVILNIPCYYDSAADTTAVTIDGYTTGASNYIKIYTPNNIATEANTSQRHDGEWNTGKYRLEASLNNGTVLNSVVTNVRIDGLQIKAAMSSTGWVSGFGVNGAAAGNVYISNSIIQGVLTGNSLSNGINGYGANMNTIIYAWNNIVYGFKYSPYNDWQSGIHIDDSFPMTIYAYNNTVYGCNIGFNRHNGTMIAKNNISYNNVDNYSGTFDAASTNNLSGPSQSDAPGTNPKNSATVTFLDEAGNNFHLDSCDTGAKNSGANLYADPDIVVTTDIDGQDRPNSATLFDIGADEEISTRVDMQGILEFMGNVKFW